MALSARTRLSGTVQSVETDGLMTEVSIELDAVIKATEVMVEN